ncbi:hypothetical protein OpiT1DRAFT_01309 [Opitutaceae bacterium TAV1]|nr:hypothetical protein OpiT1DRAFT_01309 [Opitutaceae bacterium TAV1]
MRRIAIYETATGTILRIVICPEDQVAAQAQSGAAWIVAPDGVTDATHHVEAGAFVPPVEMPVEPVGDGDGI